MYIRDLAKLCGVSHTTASMALRNDGRISTEVRARVQSAALTAGYKPDAAIAHAMTTVARGAGYRAAAPIALLSPRQA
jgi:DNA-binding LacI/PurR family transcriptional regulator